MPRFPKRPAAGLSRHDSTAPGGRPSSPAASAFFRSQSRAERERGWGMASAVRFLSPVGGFLQLFLGGGYDLGRPAAAGQAEEGEGLAREPPVRDKRPLEVEAVRPGVGQGKGVGAALQPGSPVRGPCDLAHARVVVDGGEVGAPATEGSPRGGEGGRPAFGPPPLLARPGPALAGDARLELALLSPLPLEGDRAPVRLQKRALRLPSPRGRQDARGGEGPEGGLLPLRPLGPPHPHPFAQQVRARLPGQKEGGVLARRKEVSGRTSRASASSAQVAARRPPSQPGASSGRKRCLPSASRRYLLLAPPSRSG